MHQYIDSHGNVWADSGPEGSYEMIHAESPESRAAALAEIKRVVAERQAAAAAFNAEFLN